MLNVPDYLIKGFEDNLPKKPLLYHQSREDFNSENKVLNDNYVKKFHNLWELKCKKYNKLPSILPATRRIIVIGDIHGDYNELLNCLKISNLINEDGNWIGNDTVLVQVGDQIDSCRPSSSNLCKNMDIDNDKADDIKILKFMTNLHYKALKFNGAVYSLLGNHELMNVQGNFDYVSKQNLLSFSKSKDEDIKKQINDGIKNRKNEFKPGNSLANFLACTRQVALVIGSNLFVHAGIEKHIANKYSITDLNMIISLYLLDELDNQENFSDLIDNSRSSPLWTRVFGISKKSTNKETCAKLLNPLINSYKVGKIIVGHTPQIENKTSNISNICNKKVWKVDYAASNQAFNRFRTTNSQVLEILNDGEFRVLK